MFRFSIFGFGRFSEQNQNDVGHNQYPVNNLMCTIGVLCTASRYLAVRLLVGLLLVCVSVFGFRFWPVFRTEAVCLSAHLE